MKHLKIYYTNSAISIIFTFYKNTAVVTFFGFQTFVHFWTISIGHTVDWNTFVASLITFISKWTYIINPTLNTKSKACEVTFLINLSLYISLLLDVNFNFILFLLFVSPLQWLFDCCKFLLACKYHCKSSHNI